LVDLETLTDAQQELFDFVVANQLPWANDAGFKITTDDGRLIGPFNSFLRRPQVALQWLAFAEAEAKYTSLTDRVREVVIVAVGAVWEAQYEMYAHKILARQYGLSPEVVKALGEGAVPDELSDDEKLAVRVTRQLTLNHRLDDELFREAEQAFGQQGLSDIWAVMAEYQGVCILLNMFTVPIPD
jgi:4-carboxymuconolactone decarboxylase